MRMPSYTPPLQDKRRATWGELGAREGPVPLCTYLLGSPLSLRCVLGRVDITRGSSSVKALRILPLLGQFAAAVTALAEFVAAVV